MTSPFEDGARQTTVTIKSSGQHDATWYVFKGRNDEVIADIAACFGMSPEAVEGKTLAEIAKAGTALAQGRATLPTVTPRSTATPPAESKPAKETVTETVTEEQAAQNVTEGLGGTEIDQAQQDAAGNGGSEPPWDTENGPTQSGKGWGESPAQKALADPNAVHLEAIAKAQTANDLKRYWVRNQDAFTNAELVAAYKARGKELKDAGK